ncbi:MAG: hypothetical protein ACI4TD_07475 [Phocaeicola sp.]
MVTISNGVKSFKVPSGAVKAYEPAGYHVVGKGEEQSAETPVTGQHKPENEDIDFDGEDDVEGEGRENQESDADDNFVAELLEKSLSQWSAEEIKKFVSIKGIDTTGAKKLGDVKNIIKKYLDDEAKKN